jgi:hypothetical protein
MQIHSVFYGLQCSQGRDLHAKKTHSISSIYSLEVFSQNGSFVMSRCVGKEDLFKIENNLLQEH